MYVLKKKTPYSAKFALIFFINFDLLKADSDRVIAVGHCCSLTDE